MNFIFIVFVITLCFPAYNSIETSASEPANMANTDKPTLTDPGDNETDFSTVDMLANETVLPNPRDNETDYYRFREYWKKQRSLKSIVALYYKNVTELKQYDCVDKLIFIDPNNNNHQNEQYQKYLHIRETEPLKLVRFSLTQLEQYACWDMKSYLTDNNNNIKDSPLYQKYVERLKDWKQQAFKDFNRKEQYRFAYWYAIYNSEALCDSNIVTNLNSAEPLELSTVDLSLLPDPRGSETDYNRFREYCQAKTSLKSTLDKLCNQILNIKSTVDIVERYAFWHFLDRNPIIPKPIKSNKEDWNRYNEYREALTSGPLNLANRFSVNQMNRYDYWRWEEIADEKYGSYLPYPKVNPEDLKNYKTYVEKLNSFETELSKKFSKQELSRYSYWYDYLYRPRGQFFRYLMKSMGEARKE